MFVLITGYFSARPKVKSLVNLAYICFFFAIVSVVSAQIIGLPFRGSKILFITTSNWFIPCYLCLLFFAPFLNIACKEMAKNELSGGVILFFLISTWVGFFPAMARINPGFNSGCSVISFSMLYLVGRYIRLYGLPKWFSSNALIIYIMCSLLLTTAAYISLYKEIGTEFLIQKIFAYNNPIVVLSALAFFSSFERMRLPANKAINYCAQSTLAVLLAHASREAMYFTIPLFKYILANYSGLLCILYWAISILVIAIISFLLDQIRIYSYKLVGPWLVTKTENVFSKLKTTY